MDKKTPEPKGTILVGVGAGIAAYKVSFVVREFRRAGYRVHVLPTAASLNFVGRATWAELSENPVVTGVFDDDGPGHVRLAAEADLIVIAPATADLLARMRAGLADDLLTSTVLASNAPVIAFPAMHTQMWNSQATQENVQTLRDRGVQIVDPAVGALSSGDTGVGRLPEPEQIVAAALDVLTQEGPLAGRNVVITAGGSQEPIDPVRVIGNNSSGAQGFALAQAARAAGAEVTLIFAGVTAAIPEPSTRLKLLHAQSAATMKKLVDELVPHADVLVMAAAVADYTPLHPSASKLKKNPENQELILQLKQTPDILKGVSVSPERPEVLVGFGAETGSLEEVLKLGAQKALSKGADILAVNQVGDGLGFGDVPNSLVYFDSAGTEIGRASGTKAEVALDLIGRIGQLLTKKDAD